MTPGLKTYISEVTNDGAGEAGFASVGGGSINKAFRVTTAGKTFFCKINSAYDYPKLFEKEAGGLQAIRQAGALTTPVVSGVYEHEGWQILLLEWIDGGLRTEAFWKSFGKGLAKLHDVTFSSFGFHEDNYMGALEQENAFTADWCDFFRDRRLRPQVRLA